MNNKFQKKKSEEEEEVDEGEIAFLDENIGS